MDTLVAILLAIVVGLFVYIVFAKPVASAPQPPAQVVVERDVRPATEVIVGGGPRWGWRGYGWRRGWPYRRWW